MKKKAVLTAMILAGVVLLGGGSVYAAEQIAKSSAISEEDALNFACVDAGVSPKDAGAVKIEFDFDDGHFVYDIDFVADGISYEYKVGSKDGVILDKETETLPVKNADKADANTNDKKAKTTDDATNGNSAENATNETKSNETNGAETATAENGAGNVAAENGAPNATDNAANTATDNAASKAPNQQTVNTAITEPANNVAAGVTLEQAKTIALNRAGRSASAVTFSKAKQDIEHGKTVYEIEFYVAGEAEYDYEIDAATGAVLDEDIEPWEADDDDDDDDDDD